MADLPIFVKEIKHQYKTNLIMTFNLGSIVLFVQDVDKLKAFYVDVFQLVIIEEYPSEWLLLQAGNCSIGLHKIGKEYREEGQKPFKFDNNTKIVFDIEEDIHQTREKLLAKNVLLKEVKTFDGYGYWLCDGEDPEGNVFQLRQRKQ
jgi:predicted enzyme related to lactoylglutathione lyase